MSKRLKKGIHRNDVDWLEAHGYAETGKTVESRKEYAPRWIPPDKPQLLSVGRRGLGVGYGQFKT